TRAQAVAGAPGSLAPVHDAAGGIDIGFDAHGRGRALRRPVELILARPLHPHQRARRLHCQPGCVVSRVVGAVVAVAAGTRYVLDDNGFRIDAETDGQVRAEVVDALAVRPDSHLASGRDLRIRAGGPDGRMLEEWL